MNWQLIINLKFLLFWLFFVKNVIYIFLYFFKTFTFYPNFLLVIWIIYDNMWLLWDQHRTKNFHWQILTIDKIKFIFEITCLIYRGRRSCHAIKSTFFIKIWFLKSFFQITSLQVNKEKLLIHSMVFVSLVEIKNWNRKSSLLYKYIQRELYKLII